VTDVRQEKSLTRITPMEEAAPARLEAMFAELEARALDDLLAEGFAREQLTTCRHAGMRYRGQSYEVSVPVGAFLRGAADLAALAERFHEAHRRRYGHMAASEAVEIVNFQVTAIGQIPKPKAQEMPVARAAQIPAPAEKRTVYFSANDAIEVPVFRRAALPAGAGIEGPAIIEEKTSTTVLYPGQSARIDSYLNVEIEPLQKR